MRKLAQAFIRGVGRVVHAIYVAIAWCFSMLSISLRVATILSPQFFFWYKGDSMSATSLPPEDQGLRLLMATVLSFFFLAYFVWDAISVASRGPKGRSSADEWDRARAAEEDADPTILGSTAWRKRHLHQGGA